MRRLIQTLAFAATLLVYSNVVLGQNCCCGGCPGAVESCVAQISGSCVSACASAGCARGLAITNCALGGSYETGSNCTIPLPVELVRFEATVVGANVLLSWTTASETNNAGFEVEQEIGTGIFEAIGDVIGSETTIESREYSFTVSDLSPGRYVFRLKQVDFDGSFEYSESVEATVTVPDRYVLERAYPNPFNPSTTIRFAVATESPVTLTLVDSQGRAVRTLFSGTPAANETRSVRVDAEGLASGSYIVRLTGAGFVASETVTLLR